MPRKKTKTKTIDDPQIIWGSFKGNLESILEFVSVVEPVALAYDKEKASKRIRSPIDVLQEIASLGCKVEINKKKRHIEISTPEGSSTEIVEEKIKELVKTMKDRGDISVAQADLLYRSSFVILNSFFDYFISDIIHCYYKMYPESLSDKELSISLNELKLCSDRDEAMGIIVNKKVESILYGNLEAQKGFLKRDLKVDLEEDLVNWDVLNEAIERRNIIVHNNCIVSKRYMRNVNLSVLPKKGKEIEEGKALQVTTEYFRKVYNEMIFAGLIIIQSCWRKWVKGNRAAADKSVIDFQYETLIKEDWHQGERIGLFTKKLEVSDASHRLIFDINYCQCLKWMGRKKDLYAELKKFDKSGLSPMYLLALAALEDNKEEFYINVEKVAAIGELQREVFDEWPLFRDLRKNIDYSERISKAYIKK